MLKIDYKVGGLGNLEPDSQYTYIDLSLLQRGAVFDGALLFFGLSAMHTRGSALVRYGSTPHHP